MLNPNTLLREWRIRKLGLTQRAAARSIGCAPGTFNAYEQTGGTIPSAVLDRLDEVYDAKGMLKQLVQAAAIPDAYEAQRHWVHNFSGPGGPVWAWVQAADPEQLFAATCHWGVFELTFPKRKRKPNPNGFILTSPISVPLPAVFFTLEPLGWVAFGTGTPPHNLGIPVFSGLTRVRRFSGSDDGAGLIGRMLRARFPGITPTQLDDLGPYAGVARDLFSADDRRETQLVDVVTPALPITFGSRIRRARRARRLSQADLADLARELMDRRRITQHQISRLERDEPVRVPFLHSAVDTILQADGCLCSDPLPGSRSTWDFPRFYRGPVWVELDTDEVVQIRLQWGEWVKLVRAPGHTVITMRYTGGAEPLRIQVTLGKARAVRAGTGVREGAADINDDWFLGSREDERAFWQRTEGLVAEVLLSNRQLFARIRKRLNK